MSERRIVLRPGFVISKTDGQRHYISAARLARLYKLTPEEERHAVVHNFEYLGANGFGVHEDDEVLYPDPFGNYTRKQKG